MKLRIPPKAREGVKPIHSGEFTPLPADGYVCKIVDAEIGTSKAGNDMLILNVDIAEGDFVGYFQDFADRFNKWNNSAVIRQLIYDTQKKNKGEYESNATEDKVSGRLLGLVENIEDSNPNFNFWANNEYMDTDALKGKLIGIVFAEEEYQNQNGELATRATARITKSVADIRDGNFTVPRPKKLDASKRQSDDTPDTSKISTVPPLEDPPFE